MLRFFMMYTTLIVFVAVMMLWGQVIGVTVIPLTDWALNNGFAWLVWSWIAVSLCLGPYLTYRNRSHTAAARKG